MYVYVTVSELTGADRNLDLGQLPDTSSLSEIRRHSLEKISKKFTGEQMRYARHFWYNDQFLPFRNTRLIDLSNAGSISLELKLDRYKVRLPGDSKMREVAIDPEQTIDQVIEELMGDGKSCCYLMREIGKKPLAPDETLYEQNVMPGMSQETRRIRELSVERKNSFLINALIISVFMIGLGFLLGYLLRG